MEYSQFSAIELGKKIREKEIGVVEVTKAVLKNIEKNDSEFGCYITVCKEEALLRAEVVQKLIDSGDLTGSLAGVPMSVKDNLCTKGIQTSCGSRMLKNFKPTYNATVIEKLNNAGAIILGKLNMDEFAMGSTSETSYFGQTKNPWDITRSSGGSSGGSAAAVASNEAFYTLGSDTGGSIRQPASFCGVTGIKPTYGAVSRYGLIAYASSLDQIGSIGKNVEDAAEVLCVVSGYDKKDSTSLNQDILKFLLKNDVRGKRIGIPLDYFGEGLDLEVKESVLSAVKKLEAMGAIVEEFSMPELEFVIPTYYIIACAEASSNLSRYDGIKYGYSSTEFENLNDFYCKSRSQGFGAEVKRRIMIGSFVLSSGYYDAYYKKALQVRAIIKQSFDRAFEKYDAIASPVAPTTAPKLGGILNDPLKMYLGDIYTVSANLAGLPSMAIPCGFDKNNLPIGLQLMGRAFDEKTLINIGYSFQAETYYHKKMPHFKVNWEV